MIASRTFLVASFLLAVPAGAQGVDHQHMDGMVMPAPIPAQPAATAAVDDMAGMDMSDHGSMKGALGAYAANREASGTSWQPDTELHGGLHAMAGDWMLMGHAMLDVVYDDQGGPRGDNKTFLAGMIMGMAQRSFDADTLQFRVMLSPDPLMGKAGYPLLLASGETADGKTQLTDRQHPHDLFMELSASLSHRLGDTSSAFVYLGLPGEPAFGPPAFMHRAAILDSPEAPISHHWLDSTHITYGVITAGVIHGNWKLEGSRFKGREPDQYRYDIETPRLDSTAVRLSWNPTAQIALQASWAYLKSPEQLEPATNQTRFSASALFGVPLANGGTWSSTLAWGRRQAHEPGENRPALDAWVAETSVRFAAPWTVFARGEITRNDELLVTPGEVHGDPFTVGKVSLGGIRDIQLGASKAVGLGMQVTRSFVPAGLDAAYGGDRWGGMVFLRLKIG